MEPRGCLRFPRFSFPFLWARSVALLSRLHAPWVSYPSPCDEWPAQLHTVHTPLPILQGQGPGVA